MNALCVVLATRNGAGTLPRVLARYEQCQRPSAPWRLIVVDNDSDDATPQILASFAERLPLQVLHQSISGKNRCLNAAIELVNEALIVLTDDDAPPDAGFLRAWEHMLDAQPEYAIFGGRIEPRLPARLPDHLVPLVSKFPELYAQNQREEGETSESGVFGPNMAVRRAVFDSGLRFDPHVGPDGSNIAYGMGSESEFCDRAVAAGWRFWFNAKASVDHLVRPNQLTEQFVRARAYRHGFGVGYRTARRSDDASGLRQALSHVRWRAQRAMLPRRPHDSVSPIQDWELNWRMGFLDALLCTPAGRTPPLRGSMQRTATVGARSAI